MTALNFKTQSNLVPSTMAAQELRKTAVYGVPQEITDDVTLILADNSKDYTGPGTNTYVVGREQVWIIDPGPNDAEHIDAVLSAVEGLEVLGILVTHSHLDHSPAAMPIKAATGAEIFGFGELDQELARQSDEDIDFSFAPDYPLSGGEVIGSGRYQCQVIHTPGHFPNHLCYYFPELDLLFSGDHVMGWSTTVIVPPLGNLADYMQSLDVLEGTGVKRMMPSHGLPIDDAVTRVREIREHRRARHQQVEECLKNGVCNTQDIVNVLYDGLTPRLLQAAEGCVEAHKELLQQENNSI